MGSDKGSVKRRPCVEHFLYPYTLLGTDILPTDVLARSTTLNRITYGSPPSVSIVCKAGNGEPPKVHKIGVEQLKLATPEHLGVRPRGGG